jgi:cell division protein ZapA (FtsZ GTPase activity inhibitor)
MNDGVMQINLLGTSFTIKADEDPEYVTNLLSYVETKVKEIESAATLKEPLKISILTSLLIADELFKEREKGRQRGTTNGQDQSLDSDEVTRIAKNMIERLERTLREE